MNCKSKVEIKATFEDFNHFGFDYRDYGKVLQMQNLPLH